MSVNASTERHPFASLLLLLLLVFSGAIVFTFLGALLGALIYGTSDLFEFLAGNYKANIALTKLLQIASSTGMFVVPALVFARLENKNWRDYLQLNRVSGILLLFTVLLMFGSTPLLELSVELNKGMKLPSFLQNLEIWMQNKEAQMADLTRQLLIMKSLPVLLVNLLMLAVLPAFGEEFIFRGCLQRIFTRLTHNYHLAVWISAIIFSAIHVQFYGFFPRMLLGALFGYLLVWSKSLWLPILAHFVNNATAVITAYVYQQKGLPLEKLEQTEPTPWPLYLFSAFFTILLLVYIYRLGRKQHFIEENTNGTKLG
ncbi:MAG TPA: CPBP family intramembrane glutamic endopeptidase [Daejeonella sp.]|nr:CPBP family intramembrane glutamic endopeptidase [Daejeonella sp.]